MTTLLNWAKKIAHGLIGLASFSAFGPFSASNFRASAFVDPIAEAPRRSSTSSGVPQCQGLRFSWSDRAVVNLSAPRSVFARRLEASW
jgi:hypothetical protein